MRKLITLLCLTFSYSVVSGIFFEAQDGPKCRMHAFNNCVQGHIMTCDDWDDSGGGMTIGLENQIQFAHKLGIQTQLFEGQEWKDKAQELAEKIRSTSGFKCFLLNGRYNKVDKEHHATALVKIFHEKGRGYDIWYLDSNLNPEITEKEEQEQAKKDGKPTIHTSVPWSHKIPTSAKDKDGINHAAVFLEHMMKIAFVAYSDPAAQWLIEVKSPNNYKEIAVAAQKYHERKLQAKQIQKAKIEFDNLYSDQYEDEDEDKYGYNSKGHLASNAVIYGDGNGQLVIIGFIIFLFVILCYGITMVFSCLCGYMIHMFGAHVFESSPKERVTERNDIGMEIC